MESAFGNVSDITHDITHVSESPPSSPALDLYTNNSGGSFEFSTTPFSDFRDNRAEIKSLRDQLSEKDTLLQKTQQQMADMRQELALWKAAGGRKPPKQKLDRALTTEVRRNYHELRVAKKVSYDLDLRVDCIYNRNVTGEVVNAVHGTLGSSYTDDEITAYCHKYFIHLRDDHRRKQNGKLDGHRKRSSRTIRLKRKLEKRRNIVESAKPPPLSTEQMAQAKAMLEADITYMSSDESDTEKDDGYGRVRKVRRLAWESKELAEIKGIVDSHGLKCASKQSKAKMVLLKRDSSCDISMRPVPKNILNWAVDVFYSEDGL